MNKNRMMTTSNPFWMPGQELTEADRILLQPLIDRANQLGRTPTVGEVETAVIIKARFRI